MHYDWLDILKEENIDPYNWQHVSPQIHRKSFHKLQLQPKNYIPIYTEKERKRKLGFRENIWPFRNGIGKCVLIEGDMSIKNKYSTNIKVTDRYINPNLNSTISLLHSKTEREYLHLAFNSKIFHSLLKTKVLQLGTSGKLYVASEAKYFNTINLDTVQFELDWCVETEDTIALFEAKFPKKGITKEFILFQAFYPIIYANKVNNNKKLRFFFLDILRHDDIVDYHFIEINFKIPNDLATYDTVPLTTKTIRLKLK